MKKERGGWGVALFFVRKRARTQVGGGGRGGGEGVHATHNLALHPLSPPPVTGLKIKIKIK